jgi:hypothetical protein
MGEALLLMDLGETTEKTRTFKNMPVLIGFRWLKISSMAIFSV